MRGRFLIMIQDTIVKEYFSKCTEAYDYIRKYKYFKKRFRITEKEEVLASLHIIEEINILGAISILTHCEEDLAEHYLPGFVSRNLDEISNHIMVDNENIVFYMQVSYLCMFGMPEDECVAFANNIFSGSIYKRALPQEIEFENHDFVTKHYAKVFLSAVTKFDNNILWKSHYCKIVKAIFEARDRDTNWLVLIERGLRKIPIGDKIDNKTAREYFDFLCSYELYLSAKYFLDNFLVEESLLGLNDSELIELIYSLPSAELLAFGKWYYKEKIDPDYTYERWLSDVIKYNQNTDVIEWLTLTVYYHSLQDSLEKDDYSLFESLLLKIDDYTIFDMEKVEYMKQLVECFASIVNTGLLDKKIDVLKFLHDFEKININEYSRTRYLAQWNSLESINEDYDYIEIQNILFEKYGLEDAVYIYMNSHLKNIIHLEEFVKRCSEYCGEDVSALFSEYPLWGRISNISKVSSVSDKLFLTPVGIATAVPYSKYVELCNLYGYNSKEAIAFYKRMIKSDRDWYSYNKEKAELFVRGDYCTFYIKTYKKGVGLLVCNMDLNPEMKEKRIQERNEIYPEKVLSWLDEIQKSKTFMKWNPEDNIFGIRNISNTAKRNDIALSVLRTVYALQDNEEALKDFLNYITNPPLEEMNEFRYIPTQKSLQFEFDREQFPLAKREIIKIMTQLLENNNIPSDLRKDIYLNTCARKFYDLQEVCKRVSKEFYLETADEPFVVSMKLESVEKNRAIFSTRGRNNTLYSIRNFVYYGETDGLKLNWIYLVELKEYDFEEGCFVLNRVNLNPKLDTDQWKKYLRKMQDIKSIVEDKEFDDILEQIQRFRVKVSSKEHINQWVHELDLIFKYQKYSVEKAIRTINALKDTNPFMNRLFDGNEYAERFRCLYRNTYDRFIEDYKANYKSAMGMCDFFYSSYLRIFVNNTIFFNDIVESEDEKNYLYNYCKMKNYME